MATEPDRLIVEHLDGEVLVYDTERNQAHTLSGSSAAAFVAASDDLSRREVLGRLALAGAAAAGSTALVKTIVAPAPALAQSANCGTGTCQANQTCCTPPTCCDNINELCSNGNCIQCGFLGGPCCPNSTCLSGTCNGSICQNNSDHNLKRALRSAEPRRILGLVAPAV
jgi:hypothetical protein